MQKIMYISICCFLLGCTDVKITKYSNKDKVHNQKIIDSINQKLYFLMPSFLKNDYFELQSGKTEANKIQNKVEITQSVYRTYPNGLYKLPNTFFLRKNINVFNFEPIIGIDDENKLSPVSMWVGDFYYENHLLPNVLKISEITTSEAVISITDVYVQLPKHLEMAYSVGEKTDIQSDFHTLFINGELIKNLDANHKSNFIKNLQEKGYKISLLESNQNVSNQKIKARTDSIVKHSKKVLLIPQK